MNQRYENIKIQYRQAVFMHPSLNKFSPNTINNKQRNTFILFKGKKSRVID